MAEQKILLALQFYHGDKAQANKVARLIADLEAVKTDKADFLFISRNDTTQDMDTVKYVSKKFNTFHYKNHRRGEMWPFGCNELWFGTMDWLYGHILAKKCPAYKAVLTFEADCVPITPHWIARLSEAWDKANKKVVGSFQPAPGPHINGNGLFSCDPAFLKWVSREVGGCPPNVGWDYYLAKSFRAWGWADCPAIRSWWNMATMPKAQFDQLVNEGVVLMHGVKDSSVLDHARARFLP